VHDEPQSRYKRPVPTPKRDRPQLPKGYIQTTPKGMLTWPAAKKILTESLYIWIATANEDGRPHLVQSWAVWVDDTVYFEGSDKTRWARNIAREPRISFGFQNGDMAVYGQATADIVHAPDLKLATKVAKAYTAKYGGKKFSYRPKPEQYTKSHVFRARPEKLIAFDVTKFNTSAARFTFGPAA
jgi:nitroimidazol reductase NimA-like FMN-containing flavoprotein (pyridoxamine 5'-phosphate oxidase superfamily)